MSEKTKRDQIWEKKKKEREDRLKRQREGDAGSSYPEEPVVAGRGQQPAWDKPAENAFSSNRGEHANGAGGALAFQGDLQFKHKQEQPGRVNFQSGQDAPQQPVNAFGNKKKTFIQAQKVNQQLDVQVDTNAGAIVESPAEKSYEAKVQMDQRNQQQQYNNQLQQQQMKEKQKQQEDQQRMQREIQMQKADEEKKKVEQQRFQDEERSRKEAYRNALQDQMKAKETQAVQAKAAMSVAPPSGIQVGQQQLQQQDFIGNQQKQGQVSQQQTKQELAEYLRFQMAQKNGPVSQSQPDKKALLQQQMEVQSAQPVGSQQVQSHGRKNITNMYNQPMPVAGDNYAMMQAQQQQQFYAQQQQMQPQFQQQYAQPMVMAGGLAQMQQQQQYQSNPYYGSNTAVSPSPAPQMSSAPQQAMPSSAGGYSVPSRGSDNNRFTSDDGGDSLASERGGKANGVRGNKNFMKVENADLSEVNRRQQQQQDYQRELQRQIEEKARAKKEEAEKIKKEEFLEEQRVQKEQEILRRQLEEETNSKKAKEDQTKQENENLRNEKQNAKKREMNQANGSMISGASKDFLNEEKKSEGIDERGSLMDFYRKKSSSSNLNSQQQQPQTPQTPMMLGGGGGMHPGMPMNMMGGNGYMNPMMYQNPYMMGQQGMGVGGMNPMMMGMMNPMMMQQQMLAKQQAELLPQLYELRMQMQTQQLQMQQQIDLIKNQANMAIEERNKAEQKYQEIKKQYELKQIEEKRYAEQLTEALSKNHPNNPHLQIRKDLDFSSANPAAQNAATFASLQQQFPPQFGSQQQQQQQQMSENNRRAAKPADEISKPIMNILENAKNPGFGNNIFGNHESEKGQQQLTPYGIGGGAAQGNPYAHQQMNNQQQLLRGVQSEEQFLQDAKKDYQSKMESYGMKSLVSDNKFIPLDILDGLKNKEQNISMSKLGNYGVNESAFNFNPKDAYSAAAALGAGPGAGGVSSRPPIMPSAGGGFANRPASSSSHTGKWDIPSINSDITKEIDSLMKRNGNEKQQFGGGGGFDNEFENSYYQQPKNSNTKGHKENSAYNPMQNAYALKPPSRAGSSQSMRKANRDQPFGAAARGVLGDSRAFEQQKQNMATFKTNNEQEGFNLGSDFPDFSLNNNKGGGAFGGGGFGGKDKSMMGDSVASAGNFKGMGNVSGLKGYGTTTYNQPTLNTNNFDIDKIMQRNEDRLQKLDKFGIPTINENAHDTPHEEGLDKLDQLLNKFNGINKIQ